MRPQLALFLAGAALASAPLHAEMAAGPARPSPRHGPPPKVLSDSDRVDFAATFAAIRSGNWSEAATRIDALDEPELRSVARAELYLAKGSPKVALEPLLDLIARAPDLPEAAQLSRLATTRGAENLPELPQVKRLVWEDGQPRRTRVRSASGDPGAIRLEPLVQPLIKDNQPAAAETLLTERETELSPEALTEFRQRIGWSYYIVGDDASARRLGDLARVGVGEWVLPAEWLSGLAAWRMRDCAAAGKSFATVAARSSDAELAAAGHYWAARADMMCGRPENVQNRLRSAARIPETFYGMLAQTALGVRTGGANLVHDFRDSEWRKAANRPNVKAAIALTEIGESDLAEEFIRYQAKINPGDHDAMVHLACELNLPTTQIWLAHNVPQGVRINMGARYPTPDWKPAGGWRVDPQLVFAHTLQESGFRTNAVSTAGAVGLMQVRPGSAGDLARSRGASFQSRQLTDPATNFEYGQSYLEYLRDFSATQGLLPKVIAAYNAGPAPVIEWNLRQFDGGDPLLYIESLPYWETRGYVPIILRNYWIYEEAAGKTESASREALVQGLWPRFPGLPGPTAVRLTPGNYASGRGAAAK